ncbi:MAG: N-acetylmuramoyl-L-alanine amidase [Nitrospiraceae bacterium]
MPRTRKQRTSRRSPRTRSPATDTQDTLTCRDHRLVGPNIAFRDTPNRGGIITPRYLIFHYTAGRSAKDSCDWLCNPAAQASAHLVVGRDGAITQLAPFNIKTWHAGISHWEGLTGLNEYAIGIEMDNPGRLTKQGDKLTAWFGTTYPSSQAVQAKHKLEPELSWWHTYTEQQIETALDLASLLVKAYGLSDVLGHEDIAPERKRDPGPAFPLESIRSRALGRKVEADERCRVTADSLNIRKGPGTEYEPSAPALRKGTVLLVLEKGARWTKVEVDGQGDLEGWVSNKYIEPVATHA